jgi:hypothetical protein
VSIVHGALGPQNGWNNAVFKLGAAVENSVHIQSGMSQTNIELSKRNPRKYWEERGSGLVTDICKATHNLLDHRNVVGKRNVNPGVLHISGNTDQERLAHSCN